MNNRISPRKILHTRLVFIDEDGEEFLYFTSKDISTSGIFIESPFEVRPGTKVFLKFSLYEGDAPIIVAAEVMRFMDKKRGPGRHKRNIMRGIGLKYLSLSESDFSRIRKFVEVPAF